MKRREWDCPECGRHYVFPASINVGFNPCCFIMATYFFTGVMPVVFVYGQPNTSGPPDLPGDEWKQGNQRG